MYVCGGVFYACVCTYTHCKSPFILNRKIFLSYLNPSLLPPFIYPFFYVYLFPSLPIIFTCLSHQHSSPLFNLSFILFLHLFLTHPFCIIISPSLFIVPCKYVPHFSYNITFSKKNYLNIIYLFLR